MMLRFQRAVKRNSISTSGVGSIAMGDLGLPWFAQNNLLDLALDNIINAIGEDQGCLPRSSAAKKLPTCYWSSSRTMQPPRLGS